MVDRDLLYRMVAARYELDLLIEQATAADQERSELVGRTLDVWEQRNG